MEKTVPVSYERDLGPIFATVEEEEEVEVEVEEEEEDTVQQAAN
jgi:hypothetical protein